jgi:hypothetical protein
MTKQTDQEIAISFFVGAVIAVVFFIVMFMLFNEVPTCPEGMVYIPRLGVCVQGAKPL